MKLRNSIRVSCPSCKIVMYVPITLEMPGNPTCRCRKRWSRKLTYIEREIQVRSEYAGGYWKFIMDRQTPATTQPMESKTNRCNMACGHRIETGTGSQLGRGKPTSIIIHKGADRFHEWVLIEKFDIPGRLLETQLGRGIGRIRWTVGVLNGIVALIFQIERNRTCYKLNSDEL